MNKGLLAALVVFGSFSAVAAPVKPTTQQPLNATKLHEESSEAQDASEFRPEMDSLLKDYELDEALWGDLDRDLSDALDEEELQDTATLLPGKPVPAQEEPGSEDSAQLR